MWKRFLQEIFRIRYRLLLINILIVAVPITGIGFARFYEREMLRSLEDDMIHQAQLLRQALLDDRTGLRLSERTNLLTSAARDTRTRIRLLDEKGVLMADSHEKGPPEGEEKRPPRLLPEEIPPRSSEPSITLGLAKRTEVLRALQGKYGSFTRLWENQKILYLFSALPIMKNSEVLGVVYVTRSTIPVQFAMYRLRNKLFQVLGVTLAITAILTLFFAATISRPLSRLSNIAEKIAKGERDLSLSLFRRDEIGQLARSFDRMRQELDRRANALQELAADISHEFKSPLTSIQGSAELLLDGAADDLKTRERFLQHILTDSQRLSRLLSRLLELSRLEADKTPTEFFDYEMMLREIVKRSTQEKIQLRYHARVTQIMGKRSQLASVVQNLLDNANAHAKEGSEIIVEVRDLPRDRIYTGVYNQGPIISRANLSKIWQRFFSTRTEEGGNGLGLSIVASVVSSHKGTVSVRSSKEEGTIFSFELPTG